MIRNVVLGRLREPAVAQSAEADRVQLAEGLAGIGSLDLPGLVSMHVGHDLGLRAGGWTFAITNDWVGDAAYRGYDADPEHNRYRTMIADVCSDLARVQFEL